MERRLEPVIYTQAIQTDTSHLDTSDSTSTIAKFKAMVVHGIFCHRPLAETIQAVERSVGRRSMGRWLLSSSKRGGKLVSSVVIFFRGVVEWRGGGAPRFKDQGVSRRGDHTMCVWVSRGLLVVISFLYLYVCSGGVSVPGRRGVL